MAITYKTQVLEDGKLHLDIDNAALKKGVIVTVTVRQARKSNSRRAFDPVEYKRLLEELRQSFQARDPFKGMTDGEIIAELRRQREELAEDDDPAAVTEVLRIRYEMGYYKR